MENEIPHTNPSEGSTTKRFYRGLMSNQKHLTDEERELFDCSEFVCGTYYQFAHEIQISAGILPDAMI